MKSKKWLVSIIVMVIISTIAGGCMNKDQKEKEAQELKEAYGKQNVAFWLYLEKKYHPPKWEVDVPYYTVYFGLACYKKTTGNELTYAQIYDYLSQEYEDDGEIRIYTNGRHPEIKEYVEWYGENEDTCERYRTGMVTIVSNYRKSYGIDFIDEIDVYFRNTAVMDELIKKEADPDYVMDERIMWEGLPYGPYAEGNE